MKTIKCKIKGVAPLMQHRFPVEEHGVNKKRGKKQIYLPKEEAEKALYKDKTGVVQPSEHIFGALIKAAVSFKFEGRKTYKDVIKGGVTVEPDMIPLLDNKGKQFKTWDEIDARPVVIQRARVVRWRPKFNEWFLEFKVIILDDENLDIVTLKDIMEKAGTIGLGDYRPRYGRFQVVHWEEIK